ncbi:MAG TPA: COX15/CtaA family protein [Burkholderiaceae bacterium]|nr:COX15/CtaA family protein [Burkholderiaceae bacterium]
MNLPHLALVVGIGTTVIAATTLWIGKSAARFRAIARIATGLAFIVVVVGAFVRLTDAGLGCPDWPGCYGDLTPATAKPEIVAQEQANPFGPVTMAKAWKEMAHRYIATLLGTLIVALAIAAARTRAAASDRAKLAVALVAVVMLQGAFGAWTVTLLLKPAIVTGHLIGGMLTLSLLLLLSLSASPAPRLYTARIASLQPMALSALAVVACQIVLGGWVSTNYAALACTDFPLCHGQVVPAMNFADAFHVLRPLGMNAQGEPLPFEALTAVHWTHRVFALLVIAVVGAFAWRLRIEPETRRLSLGLFVALGVQVLLGISNVLYSLPLPIAVAHNAGAAALLLLLVTVNYRVYACASAPMPQAEVATPRAVRA